VAEQTPAAEQEGLQADDSIFETERLAEDPGSCEISGTDSQRTRRFCPEVSVTRTDDERARDLAFSGVEVLDDEEEASGTAIKEA
jgi:hypothetical protein